jgi:hypothetical protein
MKKQLPSDNGEVFRNDGSAAAWAVIILALAFVVAILWLTKSIMVLMFCLFLILLTGACLRAIEGG